MAKKCSQCGSIYDNSKMLCPKDNQKLFYVTDESIQMNYENIDNISNIPKCPTCSSTNISKISTTSKMVGGAMFGLFSKTATSQFKCNNCGYKW